MTSPALFIGQTLDQYEVLELRSEGHFSWVFVVRESRTSELFAIKVLKQTARSEDVREFENEAELLIKLSAAKHVVDFFGTKSGSIPILVSGNPTPFPFDVRFHVLELADHCLVDLVADVASIPWSERLQLFRDTVLGVHQMHHRDVVHRDLKSSNCLVFLARFNAVVIKLNDLGRSRDLAVASGADPNIYKFGRGDRNFAPPEMLWNLGEDTSVAHRCTDLYGLGSILFELATGFGITSAALFPQQAIYLADSKLPDEKRKHQYRARLDEIRSWFEIAFLLAETEFPKSIKTEATSRLRQLCDPDPRIRLPKVAAGKRLENPTNLNWLLAKVDVLIKRLAYDQKLEEKKIMRKTAG